LSPEQFQSSLQMDTQSQANIELAPILQRTKSVLEVAYLEC